MLKKVNVKKTSPEFVRVREELPVGNMDCHDTFVGVEQVTEGNRVVKRAVLKEVDAVDNFKGYKVSDFFIENLEAAGAVPTNTVQYYDGDIDKVLDQVEKMSE